MHPDPLDTFKHTPTQGYAMTDLFKFGDFDLHSGDKSDWIINCEALTDEDLETLAVVGARLLRPFGCVVGIPNGGTRFAKAMCGHRSGSIDNLLIVDDVMTTGNSISQAWDKSWNNDGTLQALVIFSRTDDIHLHWVQRIFQYQGKS